VTKKTFLTEKDLAALARQVRQQAKRTRRQASRELRVSYTSIFNAEETPSQSLAKLRARMIAKYSSFTVTGPGFLLVRKPGNKKAATR